MDETKELVSATENGDKESLVDSKLSLLLNKVEELGQSGEKRKAEALLQDELRNSQNTVERWIIMMAMVDYYRENHMYLKMDKIAKLMVKDFPNNYGGYHSKYLVEVERKHFSEAFKYMETIPNELKEHPFYYMDFIELYERMNDYEGMLQYIDSDENIIHTIPEFALQKKVMGLSKLEHYKEAIPWLLALVNVFDSMDAKVTLMLLLYFQQDFGRSAILARDIMEDDKEVQSYRSFLAYYIQIYNVLMISNGKPNERMKESLNKALTWIKEYVNQHDGEIPNKEELIKSLERDIIQDRF